ALPGMANLHPLQSDESCQGMLELLFAMQNILAEIAGLDAVSLQPAAGAHGANPASAAIAGFDAVSVKSDARGLVDLNDLKAKLDDRAAVFMITNPNTLGLFDEQIVAIRELVHSKGALVYLDGANMN